jgi:hypothetical protein
MRSMLLRGDENVLPFHPGLAHISGRTTDMQPVPGSLTETELASPLERCDSMPGLLNSMSQGRPGMMRWVVAGTPPKQELLCGSSSSSSATLFFVEPGREVRNIGTLSEAYLLKTNLFNVTLYSCTCSTGLAKMEMSRPRPNASGLCVGS